MTTPIQSAIDCADVAGRRPSVKLQPEEYVVSTLSVGNSLGGIVGTGGQASTQLTHKTGANGALLTWDSVTRNQRMHFSDLYLEGNDEVGETYGLDLTGFSYSRFDSIRIRLFESAGMYGDGDTTASPVQQISNNTFIHCTFNNNDNGIIMDTTETPYNYNRWTANTFISCEIAGNTTIGLDIRTGSSNYFLGCTIQGNGKDIECNGNRNVFTG